MLNPYSFTIDGDLSRADVVVLATLCRGAKVVEYGVGASTILLSEVANKVISYDTDMNWIMKTQPKIKNNNTELKLILKENGVVKPIVEECDVLFDDGHSLLRAEFLLEFWPYIKKCAILHDSRMTYAGNCVKRFIDAFVANTEPTVGNPNKLPDNHHTGSLERIEWNHLESNMVVLFKRNCTLLYENWKITETQK